MPGYKARLPNEMLDGMGGRVALDHLVPVVDDSVRDRLGKSVRVVRPSTVG